MTTDPKPTWKVYSGGLPKELIQLRIARRDELIQLRKEAPPKPLPKKPARGSRCPAERKLLRLCRRHYNLQQRVLRLGLTLAFDEGFTKAHPGGLVFPAR
jgi:hypothetical protein